MRGPRTRWLAGIGVAVVGVGVAVLAVRSVRIAGFAAAPGPDAVAAVPAAPPTQAPPQDPEALAAWFEREVRRELARGERPDGAGEDPMARARTGLGGAPGVARGATRAGGTPDGPGSEAAPGPRGAPRAEVAGVPEAALRAGLDPEAVRAVVPAARRDAVDWDYVAAVLAGRVSGIPDEQRAGLSLQELDALGDVPFVEELRQRGDRGELVRLGLAESHGWPACVRPGTCRTDPASWP